MSLLGLAVQAASASPSKAKTVMDGNRIACEKSKAKRSAESVCINGSDGLSVTVTFPTSALTTTKQKQKTRKGLPVRVCFFFFLGFRITLRDNKEYNVGLIKV